VVNLHAEFEVSSSIRSEIWKGTQNLKSRSRDPPRPVNSWSLVTRHLTPICLYTIQLSLGYDDDYG